MHFKDQCYRTASVNINLISYSRYSQVPGLDIEVRQRQQRKGKITTNLINHPNVYLGKALAFPPIEDFKIEHHYLSERFSLAQH